MNKKCDQKIYDLTQQYHFTFILFVVVRIAGNPEPPYSLKPSMNGIFEYAPRPMVVKGWWGRGSLRSRRIYTQDRGGHTDYLVQ